MTGLAGAAAVAVVLLLTFAFAVVYANLPPIDALTDYRPKIPLRVWTADGLLMGEFGEERRDYVAVADMPELMKKAILAAEDDRFYEHRGVDYAGLARAALSNFVSGRRGQGGSTITMQVARNFFLTREKTITRKLREVLLAWKIEGSLSKDEILESYLNTAAYGTNDGRSAIGVEAASQVFFDKHVEDIGVREAALLAGLPQAPTDYNPFLNPDGAIERRNLVIDMRCLASRCGRSQQSQSGLQNGVGRSTGKRVLGIRLNPSAWSGAAPVMPPQPRRNHRTADSPAVTIGSAVARTRRRVRGQRPRRCGDRYCCR